MNRGTEAIRIGVFGHVGNRNLGDESIIAAVVENIRDLLPEAEIYGFTMNPADTTERHGIPAFPLRRIPKMRFVESQGSNAKDKDRPIQRRESGTLRSIKVWIKSRTKVYSFLVKTRDTLWGLSNIPGELRFLCESYRNLKGINLLLVCGSQQLIDYVGGPWGFPYTLYKWSIIAKLTGTKVAFLSVGAGPVRSQLGKFFVKRAVSSALYRSYRDESSQNCIAELAIPGERPVCRDLAFSLTVPRNGAADASGKTRKVVGINPVPFYESNSWIGGGKDAYGRFINILSDFTAWLINKGYNVNLFATQLNLDPPVIEDIKNILMKNHPASISTGIIDQAINSLEELIWALNEMEIVVATRYHGVVLSYALNKPVVGVAYHQKTIDLMHEAGQGEYALSIFDLTLDRLIGCFSKIEQTREESTRKIGTKNRQWKSELRRQYEYVLGQIN